MDDRPPKILTAYQLKKDSELVSVIMAEYNQLREEIRMRISHRHQLAGLSLTVSAALFTFAFSQESGIILLSIPIVTTFLGIMSIYQIAGERDIGHHIRYIIGPRLKDKFGYFVLQWDCDGERTTLWKRLDLFMMIHVFGSFVLPSIAAPLIQYSFGDNLLKISDDFLPIFTKIPYLIIDSLGFRKKKPKQTL